MLSPSSLVEISLFPLSFSNSLSHQSILSLFFLFLLCFSLGISNAYSWLKIWWQLYLPNVLWKIPFNWSFFKVMLWSRNFKCILMTEHLMAIIFAKCLVENSIQLIFFLSNVMKQEFQMHTHDWTSDGNYICQMSCGKFHSIDLFLSNVTGLEFGQFEGKASWPWLLKIIRWHRGQYAGHQGHWYLKQF